MDVPLIVYVLGKFYVSLSRPSELCKRIVK